MRLLARLHLILQVAGRMPATTMALVGALLWTAPAAAQERAATPVAAGTTETVAGWTVRLTDAVPAERIRAAYALAELGKSAAPAVSALRTRLTDENPTVRYAAAWALSEIGEGARPAIGDLEDRAAHDEVGDVRWIAAKALRKLGVADARPGDGAATHPPTR